MIRWIVGASLKFRRLFIAAAIALLAFGIFQFRGAPVEALPEFAPTRVEIQTESLGLSAEEVEQLITNPLEQEFFNGLPWLAQIRSSSIAGLSSIELMFEPGTDVMLARQVVQERLTMVPALPAASSKPPFVIQPVSSTSRLLLIGLSSKNMSQLDVGILARWTLQPRLLGIPGVANVSIWGHRDRQLLVHVDPARLHASGVTLEQVIRTTGNAMWVSPLTFVEASTPGTGGFLDTANQRIDIQHTQPIKTAQQLAQVAVEGAATGLKLGDVAEVVEDHQPLIGDAVVNNEPNMVLVVERFPNTSVEDVTRSVEQVLNEMRPGLGGLELDTSIFRPANFIEAAMNNLGITVLIGLLLLALVIGALLFDWRSTVISILTIAFSLSIAVVILLTLGVTLNLMIFAGLLMALLVVVHDAVADVDRLRQRLRRLPNEHIDNPVKANLIVETAVAMRGTMLVATLIITAAVIPVLLVTGVSGAFLRPLGLSYLLAIAVSMLVALVVAPGLAMALVTRSSAEHDSRLARSLWRGYQALLSRLMSRPVVAAVAAGLVLLAGLAVIPLVGSQQTFPTLQDRNLLIRWDAAPGASLPEMNRITSAASNELRAIPGVRNVGALIGRAITSDQVSLVAQGEILVTLDSSADYDATTTAIQRVVDGYPGLSRDVMTYPNHRMQEVQLGSPEPIVVRVYGADYNVLHAKAEEVVRTLAQVDGVISPRVKTLAQEPTVEIEVSIDKATAHGIKPGEVRRTAATLMQGIHAGSLFEEQKVFQVVVRGTPSVRANLDSLRDLLIDKPDGTQVRVGDVADVRIRPNPTAITHDAVARSIDVVADVQGRSLSDVTQEVDQRAQQIDFPPEHHLEVLGEAMQRQANQQRVLMYVAAAAILIFFLLQAAFGSWRLAMGFSLLLPVALSGGVLATVLRKDALSVAALLGLLAVLAIAVRIGIVLVRHWQRLQREGEQFGPELVLRGVRENFKPTVMTLLGSALALVPLVVIGVVAGTEIAQPMATIMIGGLLSTALVLLFVLPALYLRFGDIHPEPVFEEPETTASGQPALQGA